MARRAVMFDFGGTLMSYAHLADGRRRGAELFAKAIRFEGDLEVLSRAVADAMNEIMPRVTARPFYYQWELSAFAYRQAAESLGYLFDEQAAKDLAQRRLRESVSTATLRTGVLETLGQLRERGYILSIVSNIEDEDLHGAVDRLGLLPFLDAILTSEAARSCKPDRRIFERALEQVACGPGDAVFVGDTPAHDIDGAAAVGLETVLILDGAAVATRTLPASREANHVIREIPELLGILY